MRYQNRNSADGIRSISRAKRKIGIPMRPNLDELAVEFKATLDPIPVEFGLQQWFERLIDMSDLPDYLIEAFYQITTDLERSRPDVAYKRLRNIIQKMKFPTRLEEELTVIANLLLDLDNPW